MPPDPGPPPDALAQQALFGDTLPDRAEAARVALAPGAQWLRGFALPAAAEVLAEVEAVIAAAPLRRMTTPGGFVMSVEMTNCGDLGWTSSRAGYRYDALDPDSGQPWPPIPPAARRLAIAAAAEAGFQRFVPDACLVNRYHPGTQLTLHQDRNERDLEAPVVSVSLGLPAMFLFGGVRRADRTQRIPLQHGDVVVWGGPARLRYHGIRKLDDGEHPMLGRRRINLTFRHAG